MISGTVTFGGKTTSFIDCVITRAIDITTAISGPYIIPASVEISHQFSTNYEWSSELELAGVDHGWFAGAWWNAVNPVGLGPRIPKKLYSAVMESKTLRWMARALIGGQKR